MIKVGLLLMLLCVSIDCAHYADGFNLSPCKTLNSIFNIAVDRGFLVETMNRDQLCISPNPSPKQDKEVTSWFVRLSAYLNNHGYKTRMTPLHICIQAIDTSNCMVTAVNLIESVPYN